MPTDPEFDFLSENDKPDPVRPLNKPQAEDPVESGGSQRPLARPVADEGILPMRDAKRVRPSAQPQPERESEPRPPRRSKKVVWGSIGVLTIGAIAVAVWQFYPPGKTNTASINPPAAGAGTAGAGTGGAVTGETGTPGSAAAGTVTPGTTPPGSVAAGAAASGTPPMQAENPQTAEKEKPGPATPEKPSGQPGTAKAAVFVPPAAATLKNETPAAQQAIVSNVTKAIRSDPALTPEKVTKSLEWIEEARNSATDPKSQERLRVLQEALQKFGPKSAVKPVKSEGAAQIDEIPEVANLLSVVSSPRRGAILFCLAAMYVILEVEAYPAPVWMHAVEGWEKFDKDWKASDDLGPSYRAEFLCTLTEAAIKDASTIEHFNDLRENSNQSWKQIELGELDPDAKAPGSLEALAISATKLRLRRLESAIADGVLANKLAVETGKLSADGKVLREQARRGCGDLVKRHELLARWERFKPAEGAEPEIAEPWTKGKEILDAVAARLEMNAGEYDGVVADYAELGLLLTQVEAWEQKAFKETGLKTEVAKLITAEKEEGGSLAVLTTIAKLTFPMQGELLVRSDAQKVIEAEFNTLLEGLKGSNEVKQALLLAGQVKDVVAKQTGLSKLQSELTSTVTKLDERQTKTSKDVKEVADQQAELKTNVAKLDERQTEIAGEVKGLAGDQKVLASRQDALEKKVLTGPGRSSGDLTKIRQDISNELTQTAGRLEQQLNSTESRLQSKIDAIGNAPAVTEAQLARVTSDATDSVVGKLNEWGYGPVRFPPVKAPYYDKSLKIRHDEQKATECFNYGHQAYFRNEGNSLQVATRYFTCACERQPENPLYRYYLGMSYYHSGELEKAAVQVRCGAELEELHPNSGVGQGLSDIQYTSRQWLEKVRRSARQQTKN